MAAKQKRSHAVRRRGDSKSHGLAWFLAGAVAGGLVTWVVLGRDPAAEQVRATVERTVGHSIGVDSTDPPPKPKFEFYTLLPEMEVVVPDEDLPAPSPTPDESSSTAESGAPDTQASTGSTDEENKPADSAKALESGHYILQVASFKSMSDADGLKAQLTLLGFRPVVQTVAINSDEKWHRVRIGPYADRESLEAARIRLRADGHDAPLVVWVKKG
ncbi:MAG: SPOR domain-containing protein [Thiotrichales bacterium]|nr:SPOR domain-containing protein [Thiotrichales bacterium]